jgi:hypothetical protein
MLIIVGAVTGLAPLCGSPDFICKCPGPLFPREVALFAQLNGYGERLRLPWLGEYRSALVPRLVFQRQVRPAQDSPPKDQDEPSLALMRPHPRARELKIEPSRRAAASGLESARWYQEMNKRRDRAR